MREETIRYLIDDLPDSATPDEALAWVKRMRRIVDRWEALPRSSECALTPAERRTAHAELDEVEHNARCEMAMAEGAHVAG